MLFRSDGLDECVSRIRVYVELICSNMILSIQNHVLLGCGYIGQLPGSERGPMCPRYVIQGQFEWIG